MVAGDAARAQALEDLFHRASGLDPGARGAFLASECRDDSLRQEVLDLLAAGADGISLSRGLAAGATSWEWFLGAAALDAPARIGNLRIVQLVGSGGMGSVYLAEDEVLRRRVAVKLLHGRLRDDAATAGAESAARRFEREIEALGRLRHPGLAHVLQAGVDPHGRGWIAMRFVEGVPLVDGANARRLSLRDRLLLVAEVCDALHAAHEAGVVHCDLKPGNVLLDREGRPVVLDFGIARVVGPSAEVTLKSSLPRVLGTLAYMSPEQLAGRRSEVDRRADVWALGVLLHELVTGRLPFAIRGLDPAGAARLIASVERAPVGEREGMAFEAGAESALDGRQLDAVLDKALARDPAARYATSSDMAADLRRLARGQPVLARPPSRLLQARLVARRHPWTIASLVLAATGLLGAAILSSAFWLRALRDEGAATAHVESLVRLADRRAVEEVRAAALDLWPVLPASEEPLRVLMERGRAMVSRLPAHRARLSALQAGTPDESPGIAASWERSMLADLVGELEGLADPDPCLGLLADLDRRLQYARQVHRATVEDHAARWAAVAAAVAEDPRFGGFRLPAQVGLVPLGADPLSGLQEFALWSTTGRVPARDPGTGRLQLDAESALVMVLVPGGRALCGSQPRAPEARRFVPSARVNEYPLLELELVPFLISKHEVGQAQYARVMGSNPSRTPQSGMASPGSSPRLPVNGISWLKAREFARRVGCELPTEAQWEHAARAGSDAPWWPGKDWSRLEGAMNVADRTLLPVENWPRDATGRAFDDGHRDLAVVDWGAANAFGLHNVHGNVWEFCADVYRVERRGPFRAGDGLLLAEAPGGEPARRALRGGSYEERLEVARASFRSDVIEDQVVPAGIRLARRVEGSRADG